MAINAIHQTEPGGPGLEIPTPLKIMAWGLDDLHEKRLESLDKVLGFAVHLWLAIVDRRFGRKLARTTVPAAAERAPVGGGRA
jgi:hypothetical protein